MSIFAGVYNLFKTEVDLGQIRCQISESLSIENRKDLIYQNDHFFLLKFDYGLFDDNGYYVSGTNGVCALSGEPYINNCDHLSRNEQLLDLWDKLFHKSNDVLKECTGTYSICFYNNNDHSLLLATDKVGVRPLYFAVIDNLLYFANSLKVFEKIDAVPKILNFRSCIEKCSLGYILGTKSIYKDVNLLRDGQYLSAKDKSFSLHEYFKWNQIKVKPKDKQLLLNDVYDSFYKAVKKRAEKKNTVLAFLSGGLDSRCIVSVLNILRKNIIAINSYKNDDKDKVFAEMYADEIGIDAFFSKKRDHKISSTEDLLSSTINYANSDNHEVMHQTTVFSGDGGSVALGHVYIDSFLNSLIMMNNEVGVNAFLKDKQFPFKMLKRSMIDKHKNTLFESVLSEFNILEDLEPTKRLYVFLMRNDQRRHLHGYFDNIDLHQKEMLLPFFDSNFLEIISESPIDDFLYHKFYHEWLKLFPDSVTTIPWQAYPGHSQCEVNFDGNLKNQWSNVKVNNKVKDNLKILTEHKSEFIRSIIPSYKMYSALAVHTVCLKDYDYLFKIYSDLDFFCSKSSGVDLS